MVGEEIGSFYRSIVEVSFSKVLLKIHTFPTDIFLSWSLEIMFRKEEERDLWCPEKSSDWWRSRPIVADWPWSYCWGGCRGWGWRRSCRGRRGGRGNSPPTCSCLSRARRPGRSRGGSCRRRWASSRGRRSSWWRPSGCWSAGDAGS